MKLLLTLTITFCSITAAFAENPVYNAGQTTTLSINEPVPQTADGTMWEIIGSTPTRPHQLYQAEVVKVTPQEAGENFNIVSVGGYIPSSSLKIQVIIKLGPGQVPLVEYLESILFYITDHYITGETTVELVDGMPLPHLPDGYEWEFIASSAEMLTPDIAPGSLKSNTDTAFYILTKTNPAVANEFTWPRFESIFATDRAEARKIAHRTGLSELQSTYDQMNATHRLTIASSMFCSKLLK